MFRELTILNPRESRNQRIRLSEMVKIGIGAPSTIRKGNLMECTGTNQTTNMMNGLKKNRQRDNTPKMAGIIIQGMVKTQL